MSRRGLSSELVSGPAKPYRLWNLPHFLECQGNEQNVNLDCSVLSWALVNNINYKKGMCVCLNVEENIPTFAIIDSVVLTAPSTVFFVVQMFETCRFDPHFHFYIVTETDRWLWISY